jgi:pyridoxal phosphate enzyme (YggS family)
VDPTEQDQIARARNQILERIAMAARRAGRTPEEITLVGVSKGTSAVSVAAAIQCGISVFGENRVQEATEKFGSDLICLSGSSPVTVHLIGSLQTNKVRKAVGFFDLIHSVDSISLAKKISEEAGRAAITQSVLVQVNVAAEATKRGVSIEEASELVESVRKLPNLALMGLMMIAPDTTDSERSRGLFSRLRTFGFSLGLNRFSMGMSNDFEVAIEEGATWVRVGTALFGRRIYT